MADYLEVFDQIIDDVFELDFADTQRVALLNKAITLAKTNLDTESEYEAKVILAKTYCQSDKYTDATDILKWILEEYDKNSDEYDTFELFELYKMYCEGISEYPSISIEEYEKVLSDFENRLIKEEYSTRTIALIHFTNALCFGKPDLFIQLKSEVDTLPKDRLSELDEGWNIQHEIEYILDYEKDYDKAKKISENVFKSDPLDGEHYVLKLHMLLAMLENNDIKGIPSLHKQMEYDKAASEHSYMPSTEIIFYALTLNFTLAVEAIEKYLTAITPTPIKYFYFYSGILLFLKVLKEKGINEIALIIPPKTGYTQQKPNLIEVEDYFIFVKKELNTLLPAFNNRNSNTFLTKEHEKTQSKITYLLNEPLKL